MVEFLLRGVSDYPLFFSPSSPLPHPQLQTGNLSLWQAIRTGASALQPFLRKKVFSSGQKWASKRFWKRPSFWNFKPSNNRKHVVSLSFIGGKKDKINKSSLVFHTLTVRSGNQSTHSVKGLVSEVRGNPACGSFTSTVSELIPFVTYAFKDRFSLPSFTFIPVLEWLLWICSLHVKIEVRSQTGRQRRASAAVSGVTASKPAA